MALQALALDHYVLVFLKVHMQSQATLALGAFAIFFVGIALILALVTIKKYRQQQARQTKNTVTSDHKTTDSESNP